MENRFYSFRIVTYAKEEEFQELLKYGTKWEYILHDKDKKEDGTTKEPHWHINITLKQWKSIKGVCKLVKSEQNTLAIPLIDREKAHRYLTHKDDKEKYQYNEEEIKTSEKKFWEETESKEGENEEFIRIIESVRLTIREKAIKLGKDYIKNYKKYEEFKEAMQQEESQIKRGYANGMILISESKFWFDYWVTVAEPLIEKISDKVIKKQLEEHWEERQKTIWQ